VADVGLGCKPKLELKVDYYFCLNCNFKGCVKGVISILTPCSRCNSLLIMPLASLHLLEWSRIDLPKLQLSEADYRQLPGKKHLKLVK
jgi:hypothetical protein